MTGEPERVLRMETDPAAPQPLLDDAAKIREADRRTTARTSKRRPAREEPPAPEPVAAVTPEQQRLWGLQLVNLWNQAAHVRGWPLMPGPPLDPKTGAPKPPDDPDAFLMQVGDPVARTMGQVLPTIDQRPWLQVLLICAPFVLGAVRIETQRIGAAIREQRAAADGRAQRHPGADRPGQDGPGAGADPGFTPGLGENPDR